MTDWPVNYAEQLLFVKQMQDRMAALNKTRQPIVLNRLQTPTQAEWESAYVAQTGQTLPIPPGTRLLWRDPASGAMRPYTTTRDQNNGQTSSGAIFAQIGRIYEKGAFRLLASARGNQGFRDVKYKPHSPPPPNYQKTDASKYAIDLVLETKRGLNSLILMGASPSGTISVDLRSVNRFPDMMTSINNINPWINPLRPPFFASNVLNVITAEWRTGANTPSGGQFPSVSVSWGSGPENYLINSLQRTWPFWIRMDLIAAPFVSNNMTQTAGAISVQGFAAIRDGGFAQHITRLTAFQSYIPLPQLHSLILSFVGGVDVNGEIGKAYLYGLYENNDNTSGIA